MEILNVVSIIVAGLMVGNELSIAAFVHPALDRLPDDVHLPVATALARVLGSLPIWIVTSAILWVLATVYSITMLVPINNRIASWTNGAPPADWKTFRNRWDKLHRWRVVLLTIAFAFLTVGIIGE
jgi:uncharacterized membrane protein